MKRIPDRITASGVVISMVVALDPLVNWSSETSKSSFSFKSSTFFYHLFAKSLRFVLELFLRVSSRSLPDNLTYIISETSLVKNIKRANTKKLMVLTFYVTYERTNVFVKHRFYSKDSTFSQIWIHPFCYLFSVHKSKREITLIIIILLSHNEKSSNLDKNKYYISTRGSYFQIYVWHCWWECGRWYVNDFISPLICSICFK